MNTVINDENIIDHYANVNRKLLKYGWKCTECNIADRLITMYYINVADNSEAKSIYVFERYRGKRVFESQHHELDVYLTLNECGLVDYFNRKDVSFICPDRYDNTHRVISEYYGDKKADRSGIPYMNHIDEGCGILYLLNLQDSQAAYRCIRAFMLHPIYQCGDKPDNKPHTEIHLLARKYSHWANKYLRSNYQENDRSELLEILQDQDLKNMLIADKIQNYGDFLDNVDSYEESQEIMDYFEWWMEILEITPEVFELSLDYTQQNIALEIEDV